MNIKEYIEIIRDYCEKNNLWNIPEEEGIYLYNLIIQNKFASILECGTGGGYSTLWLAAAAKKNNGKVTTIESNNRRFENAAHIFNTSKLDNIIQIKGHCPECLNSLKEKFDFIFIDVVKHHYIQTFNESLKLLKANGIIVADNILTHQEQTDDYISHLQTFSDYTSKIIETGNGLSIFKKKIYTAYLGLGSNIAPESENIAAAIKLLERSGQIEILKKSSLYISAPVGCKEQSDFYNCAVKIHTSLNPYELLALINDIENEMGRKRLIKWGPRNIDIDILFFEDLILNTENLVIPHKELLNRRFALEPLLEIEPDMIYPSDNINLKEVCNSQTIQSQNLSEII